MRNLAWIALTGTLAFTGCKATTVATIAQDASADVHVLATLTAGAATAFDDVATVDPNAVTELGSLAATLAGKAGVSAADQAVLKTAITPQNVQSLAPKVKAIATKLATATVSAPAQCPEDDTLDLGPRS